MEDILATAHLKGDVEWQKAVGQPELTGQSAGRSLPPGRHARAVVVVPVLAVWWYRSLKGQKLFPQMKPTVGRKASASATGCLYFTCLSPKAVVCLGVGLGRGCRRSRQEVRVPSVS